MEDRHCPSPFFSTFFLLGPADFAPCLPQPTGATAVSVQSHPVWNQPCAKCQVGVNASSRTETLYSKAGHPRRALTQGEPSSTCCPVELKLPQGHHLQLMEPGWYFIPLNAVAWKSCYAQAGVFSHHLHTPAASISCSSQKDTVV